MTKIFNEVSFREVEITVTEKLLNLLKGISDEILLNGNIQDLSFEYSNEVKVPEISVNFENRLYEKEPIELKGKQLPQGYDVEPNELSKRYRVKYSFKIECVNLDLFKVIPQNTIINPPIECEITLGQISIFFQTYSQTEEFDEKTKNKIIFWRDSSIKKIKETVIEINKLISEFNNKLYKIANEELQILIEKANKRKNQNDELK